MSIRKYAVFSSYYIVKSTPPKGKIIMRGIAGVFIFMLILKSCGAI